jgi:hypothetical protein
MGNFVLDRFNGQEIYNFEKGTITATRNGDRITLWFSVECEGEPVKVLPDTEELETCPSVELTATIADLKMLDEHQIAVPEGYDENLGEYISSIYYSEHQDLDNNLLNIRRVGDYVFKVLWTGTTMDVNYYDGSKPDTRIEIDGEFELTVRK